jgi:hypothetical protein
MASFETARRQWWVMKKTVTRFGAPREVAGWGFYRGLGPDMRSKVSILSCTGFERDSLRLGFRIEFRVRCDLGNNILRLLRSRPQVEDEFDLVTWAMGSV